MQMNDATPTGPAAFGVIAERFRRAGQPEKAVSLCREGLDKFPEHLSARVTLGWSLLDMGEYQEAFDELKHVLKRAPDNLAAIRGLAELHERGIGLVFDSLSDEDESEQGTDLDPVVPAPMFATEPDPDALDDLDPIFEPERPFEIDVINESEPISLFARAPLALRDDADIEGVDELQDWLSRVRGRRSDSVSQSMAG